MSVRTLQRLRSWREKREAHDAALADLVREAAREGASSREIASAAGMSRATLWRRFADELSAQRRSG